MLNQLIYIGMIANNLIQALYPAGTEFAALPCPSGLVIQYFIFNLKPANSDLQKLFTYDYHSIT